MTAGAGRQQKTINLALQGGGAHGAFAWGVLDKILEDGRITIEGICATSAGTMNACVMAAGLHESGAEQARRNLHDFWLKIHEAGALFSPVHRLPWERFSSWSMENSPAYFWFDSLTRTFSPYQLNPFDFNPLRDILEGMVDFKALRRCRKTKLFISTTHVASGKVRVFDTPELTLDVAMASACLPFLYKAVEIEGEHYWDGGYMGNPVLYPLFYETESRDIMIVHINPVNRAELPVTGPDIMNRVNEISFNSSLIKELRAVAFVQKLLENDMLKEEYRDQFKDVLVHSILPDSIIPDLSVASKFNTDWDFLTWLRDRGREIAGAWLEEHYEDLGQHSTVDLRQDFIDPVQEPSARREAGGRNSRKIRAVR